MTTTPGDRLIDLVSPWVARGQLALANKVRRLLYHRAPDLFGRLDFSDDSTFLEPAVLACLASGEDPTQELPLACLSKLPAAARPSVVYADADAQGRVFVPGFGYLTGLPALHRLELQRDGGASLGYTPDGLRSTVVRLSDWTVATPQLTLLPFPVQTFARAIACSDGCLPGQEEAAWRYRSDVCDALGTLQQDWPSLHRAITDVVRHVVLFDDLTRNSFATPMAHGVAFLNVALGGSMPFFIEDLAHQCGHVLFAAALEGGPSLLRIPPDTPLSDLHGRKDHRTIDVLLHGMFTQALMVDALDRLLQFDVDHDAHEAEGRLAFALMRLGLDLRTYAKVDVYTKAGSALMRALVCIYVHVARRRRNLCERANFADQPYNFDYERYAHHNAPVGSDVVG